MESTLSKGAYHGDESLKSMMLTEMAEHRANDSLVKGTYGQMNGKFKGCAVGCGVRSLNVKLGKRIAYGNHEAYSKCLGIPAWLAYLEDGLFEGLPDEKRRALSLPWRSKKGNYPTVEQQTSSLGS